MSAAPRERLDVIDNGGEVIEERSPIATPSGIKVGERSGVPTFAGKRFEQFESARENHGTMALATDPPVAAELSNLEVVL